MELNQIQIRVSYYLRLTGKLPPDRYQFKTKTNKKNLLYIMKEGFKQKERKNDIFKKSEKKLSHNTQNKCVSEIGS